jgi:hypothetical protein
MNRKAEKPMVNPATLMIAFALCFNTLLRAVLK